MSWREGRQSSPTGHLFVGLLFIGLGIVFMMSRLHMTYALEFVSRGWPLILVGVGMLKVAQSQTSAGRNAGWFWIGMGVLFPGAQNGYLPFNVWSLLWPGAMIWFGLSMVWRSRHSSTPTTDSTSTIGSISFMGGTERRSNSQDFKGGEITTVMGGGKLDLREAAMSGDQAVINVFIWMGGVELMIPEGWVVESHVIPLMGGMGDKSRPPKENAKRLILEGIVLMGGIEVKN